MTLDHDDAATAQSQPAPASSATAYSPGRVANAALVVVGIIGLAWIMVELTRFLMLVFAAIVIGAVFDTIANWLCRITGMKRSMALALSVIGMITLFVGAFALFGSQLAQEFDTIRETVPRALQSVEGLLNRYGLGERARQLVEGGGKDVSQLVSQAGGYALAAGSGGIWTLEDERFAVRIDKAPGEKCGRCWKFVADGKTDTDGVVICPRCARAIA